MLTPGVSVRRSSNFRPRIGVVLTVVSFSVLLTCVRVGSTVEEPLTVKVSWAPARVRDGRRVRV